MRQTYTGALMKYNVTLPVILIQIVTLDQRNTIISYCSQACPMLSLDDGSRHYREI